MNTRIIAGQQIDTNQNSAARRSGVYEYGGWIDGPRHSGGGVNINAEDGEFMVRRGVAQSNPWLENFNKTGKRPNSDSAEVVAAVNFLGHRLSTALEMVARYLGSKHEDTTRAVDQQTRTFSRDDRFKSLKEGARKRRQGAMT